MVAWLDQFGADDLIKAYVAAADTDQVEAFYYDQFVVTRIADRPRRHQRFEQFVEPGRLRAFFKSLPKRRRASRSASSGLISRSMFSRVRISR
jgi:hypothetical protein